MDELNSELKPTIEQITFGYTRELLKALEQERKKTRQFEIFRLYSKEIANSSHRFDIVLRISKINERKG